MQGIDFQYFIKKQRQIMLTLVFGLFGQVIDLKSKALEPDSLPEEKIREVLGG